MVTKEEVKQVRNFLNRAYPDRQIALSASLLNAIDSMCADYEFRYSRNC